MKHSSQVDKMNISCQIAPFFWTHIKNFKTSFIMLTMCIFVWSLNEALFPYFIKLFIDVTQREFQHTNSYLFPFLTPLLGISIVWAAMAVCMRVYQIIGVHVYPKLRIQIRQNVFNQVKKHSLEYFTSNRAGSISSKIIDIPKISQVILETFFDQILPIGMTFFLSTIIVFQTSPIFTYLIIGWTTLHFLITFNYLEEINKNFSTYYLTSSKVNAEITDIITNIFSMKIFERAEHESDNLLKAQAQEQLKSEKATWVLIKVNLLHSFTGLIFIFINLYLLIKGWNEGWISIGDFPLIAMTSFNLIGNISQLSLVTITLFRELGGLKGALTIFDSPSMVADKLNAKSIQISKGMIEVKQVKFKYPKREILFQNLSLKIEPGEKIGLIGHSGSGKTTFVNLILRMYDILSGEIIIDGQNISDITQASLRSQVTFIPQDPFLFHRSIADNIRYGRPDASDEELIDAAKKSYCDDFISKLEQKYETIVGERGFMLSAGQRQRLAIARAILKNSPILILDEATSALDSLTEKYIQESLKEVMQNKTTIVIAHRLSTLSNMDRIIVFEQGEIREDKAMTLKLIKDGYFDHTNKLSESCDQHLVLDTLF